MFIIIKNNNEVLKIEEQLNKVWISEYILNELEQLSQNESTTYRVEQDNNTSSVIKTYTKINSGYIYNKYEEIEEVIMTINTIEYDFSLVIDDNIITNVEKLCLEYNTLVKELIIENEVEISKLKLE